MTENELREVVLGALHQIAPEVDPESIKADESLRDQIDIDSIDFVNFVIALDEQLGVEIPEVDYPEIATLDGCVAYLARHGAQRT